MPTEEQLIGALRQADAAGDIQGATRFAELIKEQRALAPQSAQPPAVETPKVSRKDSILSRFARGAADPSVAAAQLVGKGLTAAGVGYGQDITDYYKQAESQYQARRAEAGDTGTDWARIAGNIASPTNIAIASKIPMAGTMGQKIAGSAAVGEAAGLLTPAYSDNFAKEKAGQVLAGGIVGGAIQPIASGIGRLVSPKASLNPELQALKAGGVQPTIGQALGGSFNRMEEKLQVLPVMGDMISRGRGMARDDFNKMVINEVTAPIGIKVNKIGQEGIAEAGDAISKHYDTVLSGIKGVKFDDEFVGSIDNLKSMSEYMMPDEATVFNKALKNIVEDRISPAGGMEAVTYKKVDSQLGKLIANKKQSNPELSDALRELQATLREQVSRSNPEQAPALDAANAAWAKLVRLEKAGGAAANQNGVFTPAQLMSAVKGADKSTRKRAVSRGEALMQETAAAGQNVLGNKYPDSGTAGRLLAAGGTVGAGMVNPMVIAGGAVGTAAYTRPVQKALVKLATERPDLAPQIAERLNALAAPTTAGFIPNRMSE